MKFISRRETPFPDCVKIDRLTTGTRLKSAVPVTFYSFRPLFDGKIYHEFPRKAEISAKNAASTVNVMPSAVNRFFSFMAWESLRVSRLKTQRRIYRERDRELTKAEYARLLDAVRRRGNPRLYYLTQTLAATGMRVSELRFVTVESLRNGNTVVDCKGKRRETLIPKNLRGKLLAYCKDAGIASGSVFVSRSGKPLNRSNICRELQSLCDDARVDRRKVFPHNFRYLFKDIAKLDDLPGHASISATRIYIMESGAEHERQIERLVLVM